MKKLLNATEVPRRGMTRREFSRRSAQALALGVASHQVAFSEVADTPGQFRLWAMSDAHVGTDLKQGRESLADAIRQSEGFGEGPGFEWDIAVNLGDFSGNQGSPKDEEGAEIVRQFGALQKHRREAIYCVAGNHDATYKDEETQWWFRKWVDPTGEHTAHSDVDPNRMPCPIEGTWERYSFRAGNLLFLMMSDRNDVGPPVGRGERGGYPSGAVMPETFDWWRAQVEANPESIIISAHHHMLKETTVASGPWEGYVKDEQGNWKSNLHGYYADGGPMGASYLYWLGEQPDAQAFERYLADHNGAIDLWLGGHTHTSPDDRTGGRSHIERKWGVNFANVSALTRFHGRHASAPMSRLFTFTEGSSQVRVQCYLHTADFAPQGWYDKEERMLELGKAFQMG